MEWQTILPYILTVASIVVAILKALGKKNEAAIGEKLIDAIESYGVKAAKNAVAREFTGNPDLAAKLKAKLRAKGFSK